MPSIQLNEIFVGLGCFAPLVFAVIHSVFFSVCLCVWSSHSIVSLFLYYWYGWRGIRFCIFHMENTSKSNEMGIFIFISFKHKIYLTMFTGSLVCVCIKLYNGFIWYELCYSRIVMFYLQVFRCCLSFNSHLDYLHYTCVPDTAEKYLFVFFFHLQLVCDFIVLLYHIIFNFPFSI